MHPPRPNYSIFAKCGHGSLLKNLMLPVKRSPRPLLRWFGFHAPLNNANAIVIVSPSNPAILESMCDGTYLEISNAHMRHSSSMSVIFLTLRKVQCNRFVPWNPNESRAFPFFYSSSEPKLYPTSDWGLWLWLCGVSLKRVERRMKQTTKRQEQGNV